MNESVKAASVGQPYTETLTAKQVTTLNPPTGTDVQASWSLESGALPPGLALSPQGQLTGTPTTEGSWGFVIRAQSGSTLDSKDVCARRPPALEREIPVRAGAAAEQRGRDSPRKDLHRNGWKRPLYLGACVGRIARLASYLTRQGHGRWNAAEGRSVRVQRHRDGQRGARNHIRRCVDGRATTHDQDPPLEAREGRKHVPVASWRPLAASSP